MHGKGCIYLSKWTVYDFRKFVMIILFPVTCCTAYTAHDVGAHTVWTSSLKSNVGSVSCHFWKNNAKFCQDVLPLFQKEMDIGYHGVSKVEKSSDQSGHKLGVKREKQTRRMKCHEKWIASERLWWDFWHVNVKIFNFQHCNV